MASPFDAFLQGVPSTKVADLTSEQETALASRVPAELVAHWKANGFCSYWDGLLWVTDPLALDSFVEEADSEGTIIARTAFGDVFLWTGDWVEYLDVNHWNDDDVARGVAMFFEFMFQRRTLENCLHRDIFEEARKRLDAPAMDECYGFVPPLALGGSMDAASVQLMKLRPRLSILKQAAE